MAIHDILKEISKAAILINDYDFTEEQVNSTWLGRVAAKMEDIEIAERKLNVKLPGDYIQFLNITNGFPETSSIGVAFMPIDQIDYLKVLDEDLIDIYKDLGFLEDTAVMLSESILIGGFQQEQYLLIQPPVKDGEKWRYFKFASWMSEEWMFNDLPSYLSYELEFLKKQSVGLDVPKPKVIIDYSLRDQFFDSDWAKVYHTALRFLFEHTNYVYIGSYVEILDLLLMVAYKLDKFDELESSIEQLRGNDQYALAPNTILYNDDMLYNYQLAANKRIKSMSWDKQTFIEKLNAMGLDEIEEQINANRPNLLKPKNINAKIDYQLDLLFVGGNITGFISLYEINPEPRFFSVHFDAAIVYAVFGDNKKAKQAIERYLKATFNYRPFSPFLNETLNPLFDKEFLSNLATKMI